MNKTLAFLILFMLLCMSFVFAALADDTISYYALENLTDSTGNGYTLTNVGATGGATGKIDDAYSFDGTNDYMSSAPSFSSNTISISFWAKSDTTNADKVIVMISDGSSNNMFGVYVLSDGTLQVYDRRDGSTYSDGGSSYDTGWHHYVITHTGSTGTLYKDGSSVLVAASDSNSVDWSTLHIGKKTDAGIYYFDGLIDEVIIFDVALTADNVIYLYNSGSPGVAQQYPFYSIAYFYISAVDAWNGSAINTFSAYLNSSWYHTTNGTINTGINISLGLEFDIDLNATGYADRTYTDHNTSVNLPAVLYPANSVNITFKYESNNSVANDINITAEFVSDVHSEEANTSTGYLNLTLPYPSSYQIRYEAINYSTRIYTFSLVDGTYNEITLYLPMSNTQNVTISVIDTLNNVIEGATVKVLKYFVTTNSYSQISSQETNFEGKIVESLEIGSEFYQFIIEYDGDTVLTSEPSYIYTTAITLYVDLIANSFNEMFSLYNLYGVIDYTPNQTFTFTFTDGDNLATQGCLYAYRVAWDTFTKVNTSCTAGAAGTASFDVDNTSGYVYLLKGYITKGGEDKYVTNLWFSYADVVDDENSLFLVTILVLVFALIAFWRIEAAVVMTGFSLLLVTIIGIVNIPIVVGVYMFVLSLVVSFIIAKKKGGGE